MFPLPHKGEMEEMMLRDKIDRLVRASESERVEIEIGGRRFYVLKSEWLKTK